MSLKSRRRTKNQNAMIPGPKKERDRRLLWRCSPPALAWAFLAAFLLVFKTAPGAAVPGAPVSGADAAPSVRADTGKAPRAHPALPAFLTVPPAGSASGPSAPRAVPAREHPAREFPERTPATPLAPAAPDESADSPRDADEFSLGLGGTVSTMPYAAYRTQWTPFPAIAHESKYAYIRNFSAGLKIINLAFLEISVFGLYDPTSFESSQSSDRQVRRLKNRNSSAAAGLEAQLKTPLGMVRVSGAGDVLNNSNGFFGNVGYMNSLEWGDLELVPAAGLYWNNSDYNTYYYGVSREEAEKSGLNRYDADFGISPYIGLTLDYSVGKQWEIFLSAEVVYLNNEIRQSPMVDKGQTRSATIGFSYNF